MFPNDAKIYRIIATSKIRPILNITLNMNDNYYHIYIMGVKVMPII